MLSALLVVGLLSPITPLPVGDGGSLALTLQNATVHPQTAEIEGASFAIPPHGEVVAYVQCAGEPPRLSVRHQGRTHPVEGRPVAFEHGPPALWITSAREGRAALEKRLEQIRGATPVELIEPKAVPTWFGALRFAPLLLISVSTWAELAPDQRDAIRRATASGAILVIGAGEGEVPSTALDGLTAARFGELERGGPALLEALPRASTRRRLAAAGPRILADDAPLLVVEPYGLGEVRLIGARLSDVDPGPVGRAVFGGGGERLGAILDWIGGQPGLTEARRSPFAARVWLALLALIGLAGLSRIAPRAAVGGGIAWLVGAAILPPNVAEITTDASRAIAVPVSQSEDLVVATLDLTLGRGGHHVLPAGAQTSLDDARPGGACRLGDGAAGQWIVAGEPNARRRLTLFGFGKATLGGPAEAPAPAAGIVRVVTGGLEPILGATPAGPQVALHFAPAARPSGAPLILRPAPEE